MKMGENLEKQEKQTAEILIAVYDDGENISCRKSPEKPYDGFPMPRD